MTDPIFLAPQDIAPFIAKIKALQIQFLTDDPFDMITSLRHLYNAEKLTEKSIAKSNHSNCFGVNRRFISYLKTRGIHSQLAIENAVAPTPIDHAHALTVIPYCNDQGHGAIIINIGRKDAVYQVTEERTLIVPEYKDNATETHVHTTYDRNGPRLQIHRISTTLKTKKSHCEDARAAVPESAVDIKKAEWDTAQWMLNHMPTMGRVDYDILGTKWVTLINHDNTLSRFVITMRRFQNGGKSEAQWASEAFKNPKVRAKQPVFFDPKGILHHEIQDAIGKTHHEFLDFINEGISAWKKRHNAIGIQLTSPFEG